MLPKRRLAVSCLALLLLAPPTSCGRKAPAFAPQTSGALAVLSSPGGADIVLDGLATGHVTPDTLHEVEPGEHVVRVAREGWTASPESLVVDVAPPAAAVAEFTLSPVEPAWSRVVLLEAFSNVSCIGCPQLTATLHALMAEPAYGPDRLLLIEYATNWPAANDPHYQAARLQNDARMAFYLPYLNVGIPTLVLDGALAGVSGQPPSLDALRPLVDARLAADPGFGVRVVASTPAAGASVAARATLRATRAVARPGAVLAFALVQDPVTYATAPGNQGETEFHWIMRDVVRAAGSPLPLAAGDSMVCTATLARQAAWPAADLHVVAFVQDPATREVLQAAHVRVAIESSSAGRARTATGRTGIPTVSTRTPRGRP